MSMAQPRKRKKWALNPRGTSWTNDDTKVGQKLMEKMGWSKGRGLGREEQGMTVPLAVKFKDDCKGIGYKGNHDEWIKHYEGFENVLASLNTQESINNNSKSDSSDESVRPADLSSIGKTSLEKSSKTSRARVHYHKFTRGKDLSRLSEDDLACILGSKRAKQLAKEKTDENDVECVDEVGHKDHSVGVTTTQSCSIQDYFAQKMEALRSRVKSHPETLTEDTHCALWEDDVGRPGLGLGSGGGGDTPDSPDVGEEKKKKKKKKKRKKHQEEAEEINSVEIASEKCGAEPEDCVPKKKKKQKRTEINYSEAVTGSLCYDNERTDTNPIVLDAEEPQRRKSKNKYSCAVTEDQTLSAVPEEQIIIKKKKKHRDTSNEDTTAQHLIIEDNPEKKKKKKKWKTNT